MLSEPAPTPVLDQRPGDLPPDWGQLWPLGDRVNRLLPVPAPQMRPVLWGDLAELQPGDLLSLLEHYRSTGVLAIRCDGVQRVLVIVTGQLVWARSEIEAENRHPADAVHGLLAGATGTFTFLRAAGAQLPVGEPLELRLLVLDSVRRHDESRR